MVRLDNQQFGNAAKGFWEVEAVVSKYSEMSAPFMPANGATTLQQNILRQAEELLRPVGAIKHGVTNVLNNTTRMINNGDPNNPLVPTVSFYFVRLARRLHHTVRSYRLFQAAANHAQRPADAGVGHHQPSEGLA